MPMNSAYPSTHFCVSRCVRNLEFWMYYPLLSVNYSF